MTADVIFERELRRRDAILDAARIATEKFVGGAAPWTAELPLVLATIGEAADVSRVFLSMNFEDEHGVLCSRQVEEWDAAGVAPQQEDPQLQAYPYESGGFGRWRRILGSGQTLTGLVRELPPAEHALFSAQGVKSIVAVPVFVQGEWWGILGFDDCVAERRWSPAELAALRTAAGIIGVAIRLERTEAELRQRDEERSASLELLERRVSAFAAVAANLVIDQSIEDTLRAVAGIIVEVSSGVAVAIHLMDECTGAVRELVTCGHPEGYEQALRECWQRGVNSDAAKALRKQQFRVVHDAPGRTLQDPGAAPLHPFLMDVEWDTLVAVPLDAVGRSLGAIHVYYLPGRDPEADEITFLRAVADQAAVAVENDRLVDAGRSAAALQERQRLARDLHDSVSQALFSMTLHARTAQLALEHVNVPGDGPLGRSVAQLRELTQGALAEMRALIFELRPGALAEEGLVAAVSKQASALSAREGLPVQVAGPAERLGLSHEVEEHLYRIVLEALHNTVKHARASSAAVNISRGDREVHVVVTDDGVGFDPRATYSGHLGLTTMQDRAAAIGGRLQVTSRLGDGSTVAVTVPLDGRCAQGAR